MATTAVPAEAPPEDAPPAGKGKKKLLLIITAAALVLLLAGGGGAAWWMMKKNAQAAEDAEFAEADSDAQEEVQEHKRKRDDKKQAPVFLPLEMFTVNLADREAERYAQVGITLEVADAKTSDTLKAYMPAVRNDILMLLAHKKASELQERSGKLALAREIRRAAMKPFDEAEHEPDDEAVVRAVHFSSFIIQ
ncbi:MAG: flagellar basal body-associated FliL family protein [Burkholderiaceae bacterium]|nr:flagellar basal body-associated FliL family protein [Burkholderiaceae bacterium]